MKFFVYFCLVLALASLVTTKHVKSKTKSKKGLKPKDAFTAQEHCIKKTVYLYRKHYIRWLVHRIVNKTLGKMKRRKFRVLKKKSLRYGFRRYRIVHAYRWRTRRRSHHKHGRRYRWRRHHHYTKRHIKVLGFKFLTRSARHLKHRKFHIIRCLRLHWKTALAHKQRWLSRDISGLSNINAALMHYDNLPKPYKMRLKRCKLNMKPAMKRCESLYGKGKCQTITPTMVNRKCPPGKIRVGCCSCANACPSRFFKSKGFYCLRDRTYLLDQFSSLKECKKQNKTGCKKVVNGKFQPQCVKGFVQEGARKCRIKCPKSYQVIGGKCRKKGIMKLGTPFLWIKSDK